MVEWIILESAREYKKNSRRSTNKTKELRLLLQTQTAKWQDPCLQKCVLL